MVGMQPARTMVMAQIVSPEIERLFELVSPRVGVIRSLSRLTRGVEEPNPPVIYQALLSHFDFKKADWHERAAVGKGTTEAEAIAGAIGEAVEHYCALQFDKNDVHKVALGDVGQQAVSPLECVLYSESQYSRRGFPYTRPEAKSEIGWLAARELPDDHEVMVPASLVYLNYYREMPEPHLCANTSNGLAAGPHLDYAMLNGLYELVERDAFMITWMNKLPVPRVDFSALDGLAHSVHAHYQRFGIELEVVNMTLDLPIYVMMAVAVDRSSGGPAAVVGLGCNLDPVVALNKALLEVCQAHPGEVRRYLEEPPRDRLSSFQDVRTLEDHSAFFAVPERLAELSFLLDGDRTQHIQDLASHSHGNLKADLDHCIRLLREAQSRVLYVDLTTPDVAQFGLRVVRMIATGLQPIHFGFGEERLGGRRLYEVPRSLGYALTLRTEQDLNPCPHPLP